MKEISGQSKTVREILKDQRYSIDYYQREYRWQEKQAKELIEDLTEQFLHSYSSGDSREGVQHYEHYFLGSLIFSRRGNEVFIVDGQQRLTTLTLLLILLHRRQGDRPDRVKLEDLIYSEKYGKRSFNIAVSEREIAMESIFKGVIPEVGDASESIQTIVSRYQDLEELFPEDIDEAALPFFCDWLIDNVHLVEITAKTDEDAYTIFETMNDRGLSLAPLDMLKGYLLANIKDTDQRNEAAKIWRSRIEDLRKLGKEEESDAVKIWLRARHAQSVRERHRGAENKDFERIATEFHRWVGEHSDKLGLSTGDQFFHFVHDEFAFYTRRYEEILKASQETKLDMEPVFHVALFGFTLQYPLLLAPLRMTDDAETIRRKIRVVAIFLDILLARRAVNYLSMTFAAMSYAVFLVMKEVRDKPLDELVEILLKKLEEQGCDFDGTADGKRGGIRRFGLNQWSKRYIKILLARMTTYIERESGITSSLAAYLAGGKGRFEIEHIWADHPERHTDEFASAPDFAEYRDSFGGLLLLPKKFNASYGDLPYTNSDDPKKSKLPHYLSHNLLARSLHPQCYEHNPGFLDFIKSSGLPFKAHDEFKKQDLQERTDLYYELARQVWNPERLVWEADS